MEIIAKNSWKIPQYMKIIFQTVSFMKLTNIYPAWKGLHNEMLDNKKLSCCVYITSSPNDGGGGSSDRWGVEIWTKLWLGQWPAGVRGPLVTPDWSGHHLLGPVCKHTAELSAATAEFSWGFSWGKFSQGIWTMAALRVGSGWEEN